MKWIKPVVGIIMFIIAIIIIGIIRREIYLKVGMTNFTKIIENNNYTKSRKTLMITLYWEILLMKVNVF